MTARAHGTRRGSALVLALIVLSTVVALGLGYLQVTQSVTNRQMAGVANTKAFYLAEAFHAVRMGRTGQIGAEDAPARHGEGLLWVDAFATVDEQVRLESTALVGGGRKTLSLVVEPVEIPLGFFSDEDLVIEEVLLVDGFNSDEATYEEEVGELPSVTFGPEDYLHDNVSVMVVRISEMYFDYAYREGDVFYYVDSVPRDPIFRTIDARDYFDAKHAAEDPVDEALAVHTDSGGLLSSNGDVTFALPSGEPVAIYGDVVPGPNGTVLGLDETQVTGSTEPRNAPIELPPVEVPTVDMAAPVRHDDVLPLLISPGTSGHEQIVVAADSELILRGPSTVVIGELVLEPGAFLSLDTRDGDVSLIVTEGMDLQPGSTVTTTSDLPEEVAVQVGEIPTGVDGAPVKLEATSQFHGTVYAPSTEVKIGSEFEIYGGVVARKLEIGPGARLHFDSADYEGSPLPRFVAWRIMEIPAALKARLGSDPYAVLGVERDTPTALADSHDLASVTLTITFLDQSGFEQSYEGPEDGFDWSRVSEVLTVARVAHRTEEDPAPADPTGGEEAPEGPTARQDVIDALANLSGQALQDYLQSKAPLSDAELIAMMEADVMQQGGGEHAVYQFESLQAATPLSENVMLEVLKDPTNLFSADITSVLLASSPLPDSVIATVNSAPSSVLFDSDKAAILQAQPR